MFYHLKQVLKPEEARRVMQLVEGANFVSGRATNQRNVAKRNLQLATDDPRTSEPGAIIREALSRNTEVNAITRPVRMTPPLFSRYEPGMEYGDHADQAIFLAGGAIRADVSCTVFLHDGSDYEGGELVVRAGDLEQRMKGSAGDVVLYPSISLHRVEPVTKGVRQVAVNWFQSSLRDAHKREVFYNLQRVLNEMIERDLDKNLAVRLNYVQANLLRMWAEL